MRTPPTVSASYQHMEDPPSRQPESTATAVEFTLRNSSHPFVAFSESEDCRFELGKMVPRGDDEYAEYFNVTDVDPDRIVDEVADESAVDVSLLRERDDGALVEFVVSRDCPAVTLAELGALPRGVHSADGEGRITAEVPPQYDPSTVVEAFQTETAGMELVTKREKSGLTPLFAESAVEQVLRTRLTDRQREVLEAAYEAGYYAWPQETTGSEVAASLDISSTTFSEHIHAAERKLLGVLFEERSSGSGRP